MLRYTAFITRSIEDSSDWSSSGTSDPFRTCSRLLVTLSTDLADDPDPLDLFRRMLRGRRFDERVLSHRESIAGHFHVSMGLEAVAAAVTAVLQPQDGLVTTYRNHALLAALGTDLGVLLAEILGRGPRQHGRSGSTHLNDPERGVPHTSALVGGGIPHALGIGLVFKRQAHGRVCVCVFGEGAFGEGVVHEALNIASLWQLPIVFICENNSPGLADRAAKIQSAASFAAIATTHEMPAQRLDGADVFGVSRTVQDAVAAARVDGGPHFIEAVVPPWPGNSTFFPHDVTGPTKLADLDVAPSAGWQTADPVLRAARALLHRGVAFELLAEADHDVCAEVNAADRAAVSADQPSSSSAFADVVSLAARPRTAGGPLRAPDGERTEYWVARWKALDRELSAHPDTLMIGGYLTLPFCPPDDLLDRHGGKVVWPPTSEMSAMGIGVGAAMAGRHTLVPIGTSSFMFYGWPQIVTEAPNVRYLSGGKVSAPVVYHIMAGSRRASGVQHEHTPQAMLQNVPGLVILAPGTPADVDGLFNAAFELDDPVLFVDHLLLNHAWGEVPQTPQSEIGRASLLRDGNDLLIVAYSSMVVRSLEAAATLQRMGFSAGVLNLRTLAPLPLVDVIETAGQYPAVLFVDESRGPGSTAGYLAARVAEAGVGARLGLCVTADAPAPFNETLLDAVVPTTETIIARAAHLLTRAHVGNNLRGK
jgi:TPP-dependent pyruvate/acetoin dehydrogenase alpha subunit/pyruvate/2-oxoglutarate/acetoin dehydrogenase E1 component